MFRRPPFLLGALLSAVLAFTWLGAPTPAGGRPVAPARRPARVDAAPHLGCRRDRQATLERRGAPFRAEETFAGGAERPLMVVVGASFTAGVGAAKPSLAWPYLLGRLLDWRVLGVGVPGAGYVAAGEGFLGPLQRELVDAGLRQHHPKLVILQAGHNDLHVPAAVLRRAVTRTIGTVRRFWPQATVVALTVFPKGPASERARATDRLIVETLRTSDPSALILNPIAGHWRFPTVADHLHPTQAGHLWIAERVAKALVAHGLAQRRHPADPSVRAEPLTPSLGLLDSGARRGGLWSCEATGRAPRGEHRPG